MMKKNILLLCGGGGTEHDISKVSSQYILKTLNDLNLYHVFWVEMTPDHRFCDEYKNEIKINFERELILHNGQKILLHLAIPCIHGPPGETGEIQAFFELIKLPYLGCGPFASQTCFNKITSKLWFSSLGIPNTPFLYLNDITEINKAYDFFHLHGSLFVKAASQGSSVGCYQVLKMEEIDSAINSAFKYSDYVLIEKKVTARELEISTYEFNGKIHATLPGEIVCPSNFYSFEEKYANESKTRTDIQALNIDPKVAEKMREYALLAFTHLKLRHLSRIDFFYTSDGEIYLNEINTFPGMTPISMFPKMMENNGHLFSDFIKQLTEKNIL